MCGLMMHRVDRTKQSIYCSPLSGGAVECGERWMMRLRESESVEVNEKDVGYSIHLTLTLPHSHTII